MISCPRRVTGTVAALALCALPVATVTGAPVVPSDPGFASQWGLHQGSDNDIDAPEGWALAAGRSPVPVTVGVIEPEIQLAHPDLTGQLWVNPGEIAGNELDDDENGYVDDVHGTAGGWRGAVSRTGPGAAHGTAVAGVIAARHDNDIGLAGVAPNARIMALTSWPEAASIEESLRYAVEHGARVVNISSGGPSSTEFLATSPLCAMIAEVSDRTLVVVAAGNDGDDGTDSDATPFHPAGCAATGLAVAMSAPVEPRLAWWSNYGRLSVDLAAPGESVPVLCSDDCGPTGHYRFDTGTSFAAPHVAGAAALLFGLHPEATPAQVREAILQSVTPLITPAGEPERPLASSGQLNLAGAIAALDAMLPPQDPGPVDPGPITPAPLSSPAPPAPAPPPAGSAGSQGTPPVVRRPALTRARALAAIRRSRALARPLRALAVSRRPRNGIRARDLRLVDVTRDGRRDAIARVRKAGRPAGWIVVSDHFGAATVVFSTRARLSVRVRRGRLETVRKRVKARPRIVRYALRSGRLRPIR